MPSRTWPMWALTGLLLLGYPVMTFVYWTEVLRSGVLPWDGDSIGIPIGTSVIVTLVLSPVVLGVTWLCLKRYNPETRLAAWRTDRPVRSALATALFGGAAALLLILLLIVAIADRHIDWPWYGYLAIAYFAFWVPWLLGLRAAVIEQLGYEPTYTER